MANIMNMVKLRNKPSRNGFDLSTKRNFTAKAGELLPVYIKESILGDVIDIDLSTFTRTVPINTSAFVRMREYYDFFFVPFNLLWNKADTVLSQMDYNSQHATQLSPTVSPLRGELPYLTAGQVRKYINDMASLDVALQPTQALARQNMFGYDRATLSCKLLDYLGIGNFRGSLPGAENLAYPFDYDFNIFPILAYQKIYADFFRDDHWEMASPSTFNVDYMSGFDTMNVNIPDYGAGTAGLFYTDYNMFDLRYCNWSKDMYHGLLPQAQYGDESVVPLSSDGLTVTGNGEPTFYSSEIPSPSTTRSLSYLGSSDTLVYTNPSGSGFFPLSWNDPKLSVSGLNGLSILALRQYEFLQKWKEIVQSAKQDYKSQMDAIWGTNISKHLSQTVTYLGGVSTSLDINEVVNTNITSDNAANIAGKGVSSGNGHIRFENPGQFGYVMCIYHCLPIVDYTTDYINPQYLRVNAEDFANPVFDRVGMQQVTDLCLCGGAIPSTRVPSDGHSPIPLGYGPRYLDYKTDIDLSFGAFKSTLAHWVCSYDYQSILDAYSYNGGITSVPAGESEGGTTLDNTFVFFKINPALLNPVFSVEVDSTDDTDQLLCSSFFDVKAVRNLDVDGLPY